MGESRWFGKRLDSHSRNRNRISKVGTIEATFCPKQCVKCVKSEIMLAD